MPKGKQTAAETSVRELQQLIRLIRQAKQLRNLPIEELVLPGKELDQLAEHFAQTLKPTQLRRVFHDFKRLERQALHDFPQARSELIMTLPELAYAYGRDVIPKEFYKLMKELLNPPNERLQDKEDVQALMKILTTLLAYHKFHGR